MKRCLTSLIIQFLSVQSLSHVLLFATPWTAVHQASLSITNSWSLLKLMSIESVMPSNHLIFCHPPFYLPSIFPSIRVFSNESVLRTRWPKYWSFSSASVLPMNNQDWFALGLTGWMSLQSKGLKESSPAPQFESINSSALSLLYGPTFTNVNDYWKNVLLPGKSPGRRSLVGYSPWGHKELDTTEWCHSLTHSLIGKMVSLTICTSVGKVMSLLMILKYIKTFPEPLQVLWTQA